MPSTRASPWVGFGLLLLSNAIFPVAIGIFASGFFPYKAFLPGRNSYRTGDPSPPDPVFDKVIFMVVDALRSDFVFSSNSSFSFVQSLIQDGAALPFTAHATSPTITMPRVKAITTGSIPSFLDVILNFAEADTTSTLATQDSWPAQLSSKDNGKVNMFGDDTWLKLFPDFFSRADGTSSFFVSDFTEVDNNVTRNVPGELRKDDWNGMIMHYLGLDHIGHKSGPRSPHMPGKQREMDGIARQIYTAMETETHLRSTLFVMCGDHGMNDAGNHGGSGAGETSPALVLMSPKLRTISQGIECPSAEPEDEFQYYQVVEQSDIAPTLAGLLGFPIPLNNLGIFIPRFLDLWSKDDDKLNLLQQNAEQVHNIVEATFGKPSAERKIDSLCTGELEDGELLHCLWQLSQSSRARRDTYVEQSESLVKFLQSAQDIMSSTASNYDIGKLQLGVGLAALSLVLCVSALMVLPQRALSTSISTLMLTTLYGAMMFGSSFVEEEHHFWYWSISGCMAYLFAKSSRTSTRFTTVGSLSLLLLGAFRILRRWNQTGQKFAGSPDISRTILPDHQILVWLLITSTIFVYSYRIASKASMDPMVTSLTIAVTLSVIGFKISFTFADAPELLPPLPPILLQTLLRIPLPLQANTIFIGLISLGALVTIKQWNSSKLFRAPLHTAEVYQSILSLFLLTQSRVLNIPLFLLFHVQYWVLKQLSLRPQEITSISLMMQYASYFAFGGTNAISSIDLSSAYNGVSSYNVVMVGILTFVGNWAGPMWWSMSGLLLLFQKKVKNPLLQHIADQTLFKTGALAAVMVACTILRTHLFIWTVFSPKYLYSMAWSLGQHLGVNVVLGLLLSWACSM